MARYSALFDANVLFSRELRYLFVALARTQLFRARWNELTKYDIEAQTPDKFLSYLLDLHPEPVCEVIQEARLRLKKPSKTVWEYLDFMNTRLGLEETAKMLLEWTEEI